MENLTIKFRESLLHFWVNSSVTVDNRFVVTHKPKLSFFGLIPMGGEENTIPLKTMSNLKLDREYSIRKIVLGSIAVLTLGFGLVIPIFWGIKKIDEGMRHTLTFEKSGTHQEISVPFFEKEKITKIKNAIHKGMSDDIDRTDLGKYFNEKEKA